MKDCFDALRERKNQTAILFAGQAGFIIKSKSGQTLAIDLYLSDCVETLEGHIGFKRLVPNLIDTEHLKLDVVVATHSHLDHFDKDALPAIMKNGKTRLFASFECRQFEDSFGADRERIKYVSSGDVFEDGEFKIHFINCDHGEAAPDAVGIIVEVDGKRICETGDTRLRLDRVGEYLSDGSIDVLIAPINGKYGNMDSKDLAMLSSKVKPKITIPCHFGMFASHGGEPELFMEYMNKKEQAFTLMTVGEAITV